MKKWAYQTLFLLTKEDFDTWANEWGEQGWEIYQVGPLIKKSAYEWGRDVFMKRPSEVADRPQKRT